MDNKLEYRSTIKSTSFLYIEMKKAGSLILQGFSEVEIMSMSIKENIFQIKTESRKKEVASTVVKRLRVLDEYLVQRLVNGDVETSKQITIYSIIKTDRLFFEFLNEVYRDKIILKEKYITDADFNVFFQRKREQSEKVASWNDYTFYKLKQVIIRVMYEAGLIKNQKDNREITIPIIEKDILEHTQNIGDGIYLRAMLGES